MPVLDLKARYGQIWNSMALVICSDGKSERELPQCVSLVGHPRRGTQRALGIRHSSALAENAVRMTVNHVLSGGEVLAAQG